MALPQVVSSLGYKTWNNINFSKLKIKASLCGIASFLLLPSLSTISSSMNFQNLVPALAGR